MQEDRQSFTPPDKALPRFQWSRPKWIAYGIALAIVVALYLWSRGGGTTHVRVEVRDNAYTLSLDGHTILSERISAWDTGGIGYRQYRKTVPIIPHDQVITNIVVTDLDTNEILFAENFQNSELDQSAWPLQMGEWEVRNHALTSKDEEAALIHPAAWKNYAFEAQVRNMLGAQFFVRVQDQNNYVGCFMRPFRDFDGNFFVIKNGRKTYQTPVKTVLLSPTQTAKRSLNLVLHYLPHFIVIFVLAILLTLALTQLLHWLSTYLSRFITITVKGPTPKSPFTVERCFTALALLLVVAAFFWLLQVTSAYLERVPHVQDSATMVFQAKTLARGRLWATAPADPQSFVLPNFIHCRDGKLFGQYPFGHPLFLVPGALLNQVWVMPAVAGALLLLVVFLIGKELLSALWAFLAALLLFCSPFYQMSAPNLMSHTTGALYLALSVYFLIKTERPGRLVLHPLLCGVFLGLLFNTRPMTALGVGGSYALFMLYSLLRSRERRRLLFKYLLLSLGFLAIFSMYFLYNYVLMGDPFKSTYGATADKVLKGAFDWPRCAKAFLDNFTLASLFLMLALGSTGLVSTTPLFGVLLPPRTAKRYAVLLASSLIFVFGAYMFYSISSVTVMYGPRYVFEVLFLFMLLLSWGIASIARTLQAVSAYWTRRIARRRGEQEHCAGWMIHPAANCVVTCSLLLIFAACGAKSFTAWTSNTSRPWPGNAYIPQNVHQLKGFNHVSPVIQEWVQKQGITNALVFVEGPVYQWWHYGSVYSENTPTFDGEVVYVMDRGKAYNKNIIQAYPDRQYYIADYDKHSFWQIDGELNRIPAETSP